MYKHNHALVDPSLWHNADELRKQLSGACIITAQEKPETNRAFREDIYQKNRAGDDLAGRRSISCVTGILHIDGLEES